MADDKTFTQEEHLAVLADRVAKETAELTATVDRLTAENTELANQLDVEKAGREAAEQKVTETAAAFEEFKAKTEADREAASRMTDRVAKLREAASHMEDEFFQDQKRIERVVAMSEEQFSGYLDDLTASRAGRTSTGVPRETAMTGSQVQGTEDGAAGRDFLMRPYIAPGKEG